MQERNNKLKRGTIVANTGWLILGSILTMVIQLIIGIISARYLGPSNYGVLNYVTAFVNLFSIICELGLTIVIVGELVNAKNDDGEVLGTAILLRAIVSIVSIILLQIIISITDPGDSIVRLIMLVRSVGLIFESFNSIHCWYEAKLQSKYPAIIQFIAYIVASSFKIYILATHKDVVWFSAAAVIDTICIAVFYVILYFVHSDSKFRFSYSVSKRLIKAGLPFIASGIMVYIYGQTDRIMIGKMINQTEVGYYSCAATIASLVGFIAKAIMNSGKTIILEAKQLTHDIYMKRIRFTLAAVLWTLFLYSLFIMLFGRIVVRILYGIDYVPAVAPLKILVWSTGFSYIGTIRNVYLVSEHKNRFATIFSSLGAIMNIFLNLVLINKMGAIGASIATLITEISTSFILPTVFPKTREFGMCVLDAIMLRNIDVRNTLNIFIDGLKRKINK